MQSNQAGIKAELLLIKQQSPDGKITPEAVVEFAKNPNTALHKQFTWDVASAAHAYWIEQARYIIQNVKVTIENNGAPVEIRAFVSLQPDRVNGGGYREFDDVMRNKTHRQQYLLTALAEFDTLRRKYEQIKELVPVFSALETVRTEATQQTSIKSPVAPKRTVRKTNQIAA